MPAIKGIRHHFTLSVLLVVLSCLTAASQAARPAVPAPFTVVLDAGHGGHDPGNLGNGFLEKDIALKIVLAAGRILEQQAGTKVIYTRDSDRFVDLYVRGEIANKAKADLFVSVHCDSHTSNANGAGTFVLGLHANKQNFEIAKKENSVIYLEDNYESRYAEYDINSPESIIGLTIMQEEFLDQSILLGKLMQDRFTGRLGRNDRKVKQAGFIVLHQTFMPSVLVETGFLTNKDEGRYLNSAKGQQEMGQAIANAILEYRKSVRAAQAPVVEQQPEPQPEVSEVPEKAMETQPEEPAPAEEPVKTPAETPESAKPAVDEAQRVTFKVQLAAVSKAPVLEPSRFNGLDNLSQESHNGVYRILYGNTESYEQAQLLQKNAVQKGYSSAYIAAYRNGVRIPLAEALKTVSQ
ncbi:N-acetylmuramoyl-L-alanine amidase [Robiginitalea sp. M366]|uniref:N-acetylmuramoyl-L-alanine amidase family protein n=1 Tax=Robiginitalea aestuariiviva TaxID=3036903 RepID=UPI00240DED52|nr:N-acetylmuramoyl-L-alanine amidase [Robiginitalea aestuariiviva]MDG1572703.1 N-acetylmuramoyl-L-alanine amidase [Robiginitalea aestuariiviva]